MIRSSKLVMAGLSLAFAAAACSSTYNSSTNPPATQTSTPPPSAAAIFNATSDRTFVPLTQTIKAGQTVNWANPSQLPHNVTFDNGPAFSQNLDQGATVTRTFAMAGTFKFHCAIHGPTMHGTIVVT